MPTATGLFYHIKYHSHLCSCGRAPSPATCFVSSIGRGDVSSLSSGIRSGTLPYHTSKVHTQLITSHRKKSFLFCLLVLVLTISQHSSVLTLLLTTAQEHISPHALFSWSFNDASYKITHASLAVEHTPTVFTSPYVGRFTLKLVKH